LKSGPDDRFFLGRDNSGHAYVIPVENKSEWFDWLEIREYDERSWITPKFARAVTGFLTFTNPEW
jgi:phage baseplate assembly protein gpV